MQFEFPFLEKIASSQEFKKSLSKTQRNAKSIKKSKIYHKFFERYHAWFKRTFFLCKRIVTRQMNQTRSVMKIIKKRKTEKYVSSVIEKSVKVMQRTVFGFSVINAISDTCLLYLIYCRARSHRKNNNLFHRTTDIAKLCIAMSKNSFVVCFFLDK